ncbi:MAG: hypothetical protein N2690_07645 [Rhodocyclaceae bacterium]|nr:hypothetical protein [Rhodocyclaceae bacterium]
MRLISYPPCRRLRRAPRPGLPLAPIIRRVSGLEDVRRVGCNPGIIIRRVGGLEGFPARKPMPEEAGS